MEIYTGIDEMPNCLPDNISSLTVQNSPNLTAVHKLPKNITELRIISTGLTNLDPTAISAAVTLEVSKASILTIGKN